MQKIRMTAPLAGRLAELAQNSKGAATPIGGPSQKPGRNKWSLLRMVAEIKHVLGLNDRSLSLLSALVSFHPETEWSSAEQGKGVGLVVFPSNRQLCLRAHGMAEKTMRRHLAHLVNAGLIIRRDSPNGKRYVRRDPDERAQVSQAFGFDLSPLLERADLLERQSRWEQRCKVELSALKERISLLRRDLDDLIGHAVGSVEHEKWMARFSILLVPVRSLRSVDEARSMLLGLETLSKEISVATQNTSAGIKVTVNHGQIDRHQSESETEYIFDSNVTPGRNTSEEVRYKPAPDTPHTKPLTLGLVLDACPDLHLFKLPGQEIESWNDLSRLAAMLRPALGVSDDAWAGAMKVMGEGQASAAIALILQRSEFSSDLSSVQDDDPRGPKNRHRRLRTVKSPGGYLRRLTEEALKGSLKLSQALTCLASRRGLFQSRGTVSQHGV